MTSYSQSNYNYNNENDALSYSSQPISTTNLSKSISNYGNHLAMYDRYDNTRTQQVGLGIRNDYSDIDAATPHSGYDYAVTALASTTTTAGSDKYIEDDASYCDVDSAGGCYDYWDDADDSGSASAMDGRRHSSLGNNKMLPKVPIKHSSSMLDGMYISNCHQNHNRQHPRYGASLPTTPPVAHKKSRMLPQPGAASNSIATITTIKMGDGSNSAYGSGGAYGFLKQPTPTNGYSGGAQHNSRLNSSSNVVDKSAAYVGGGVGSVNGKCLPTVPFRVLPQPQAQQQHQLQKMQPYTHKSSKHELIAAATTVNELQCKFLLDDAATKHVDNSNMNSNFNDNTTINDYSNYTAAMYSSPSYSYSAYTTSVAAIPMKRPHTSMQPLNYKDDFNYPYNSADSLSTYSEPTATLYNSTATQLNLQHQRKSSIIMAMTTASVIASGETRLTPNINVTDKQQQQQQQTTKPYDTSTITATTTCHLAYGGSSSARDYRSSSFEYDCTGVEAPKQSFFDTITTTDDHFFDAALFNSRYTTIKAVANADNTTTALTAAKLLSTSVDQQQPQHFGDEIHTAMTTTSLSRKLPKRLPTPNNIATNVTSNTDISNYNSSNINSINNNSGNNSNNNNNNGNSAISSNIVSCSYNNNSTNNKQLPKLPSEKLTTMTTTTTTMTTSMTTALSPTTMLVATSSTAIATSTTTYEPNTYKPFIMNDVTTTATILTASLSTPTPSTTSASATVSTALVLGGDHANIAYDSLPHDVYLNKLGTATTTGAAVTENYETIATTTAPMNNNNTSLNLSTISSPTATLTALDYSDYLKSYTLPTFSAYMSDINRTSPSNATETKTQISSVVPSATSPTSTALTSIYQSSSTAPYTDISHLTLLDTLSGPSTSTTTETFLHSNSINFISKYEHYLSGSSKDSSYTATDTVNAAKPITAKPTDLAMQTTKSSSYYPLHLDIITTTTSVSGLDTSAWSSIKAATAATIDTTPSNYNQLFTTTVSSAELANSCYTNTNSDITAAVDYITRLQPIAATAAEVAAVEATATSDLTYEEYLKKLNLDIYSSETMHSSSSSITIGSATTPTTTPLDTTTATKTEHAQYTSDMRSGSNDYNTYKLPTVATAVADDIAFDDSKSWYNTTTPTTVAAALTEPTEAKTAFDDSFYDSYDVDLSCLTATTFSEPKPSMYTYLDMLPTTTTVGYVDSLVATITTTTTPVATSTALSSSVMASSGSTQGGYYQPSAAKSTFKIGSTTTAITAAGKASSMLGGLSKGLKGGLDGVLSGVSNAVTTTTAETAQQPQQQQTKKGFGFGLASKLVPNVSGLLQKAQPAAATTTVEYNTSSSSGNNSYNIQQQPMLTTAAIQMHDSNTNYIVPPLYTTDKSHAAVHDISSNAYYNNNSSCSNDDSQFLLQQSSVLGDNDISYDDYLDHTARNLHYVDGIAADPSIYLSSTKIVDYSTDYKYGYDEYGYSESDYIATGDIMEKSDSYNSAYGVAATTTATTTALGVVATATWPATCTAATSAAATTTASGSDMSSDLFSSLTNAVTQVQSQQPTSRTITKAAPTTTASGTRNAASGGGMFGSFLGKAAAAVQSATQAVNQGASLASAVVQKTPLATTAQTRTTPVAHFNDYGKIAVTTQYDDYTNCNATSTTTTTVNNRNNNYGSNYYVSESSSDNQQAATKILPTVPPAGSTGKKLPTINGKSGFLIKQQPTELFDDEDDVDLGEVEEEDDDDDIIDEYVGDDDIPNYRLDSEQNDYYMDQQQTAPLSRQGVNSQELVEMVAANGYYEHANSCYDYREDFFNEEDEYKYLEKEEQKAAQEAQLVLQRQQHTQVLLHQHQKQPPLEYIEESRDDYIDDNYPSEDSGNYLEESSSGSGGGVGGSVAIRENLKKETSVATATSGTTISEAAAAAATAHQQIKKQDSIILEEDEDEDKLLGLDRSEGIGMGPSSSGSGGVAANISRKSSDIMMDDDQMTDLPQISLTQMQKKKRLMRGETEEVVGGHMSQMIRKPEVTAKQRWHWAYNKITMQLNVSTTKLSNTDKREKIQSLVNCG